MQMPDFHEKFRSLRERRNIKPAQIAKALGVSRTTVMMWDTSNVPNGTNLTNLSAIFGVTPQSLVDDKLEIEFHFDTTKKIPLISYEQLGLWAPTGTPYPTHFERMETDFWFKPAQGEVALQMRSDAMGLVIPKDAYVIAIPCETLKDGQCGFFNVQGHILVGQYREEGPRKVLHFEAWQDRELTPQDKPIARIRRVWRNL